MIRKILTNPLLLTATLLAVAAVILLFVLAVTSEPNLSDGSKVTVRVDQQRITAVVAAKGETQSKGLAESGALSDKQGMLFVYSEPIIPTFFMRGMAFPIDIIWINGDTVTDVTANIAPEPGVPDGQLKKYSPPGPVDRVLEVNSGFASRHGVQPGDPIRITSF